MGNNKKFVFVLGAGASRDFGYPTGIELIETITKYKNGGVFINFMKENGIFERDVKTFADILKESGLNSIDAFLTRVVDSKREQPVDFETIGRACIAYTILFTEKQSKILELPFRFDDNWYRYLFSFFDDNYAALIDGRVRFLTFNYDLSLEYFIATSYRIRNYLYAMSLEEKRKYQEFLSKIKILHFYGQAGNLNEFVSTGREYGVVDDFFNFSKPHMFREIAKNIEIVRPQVPKETQIIFNRAQQYLTEANYVFFLGFGFDVLNMERLGLEHAFQAGVDRRLYYVTTYGADNSSIYDFENRIFPDGSLKDDIYTRGDHEEKIVPFLKNKCFILSGLKE